MLSPQLRHAVADQLRWQGLRPVQEVSIPAILAGENVIVLAPTAGGKTEAAFLPVIDLLALEADPGSVGALYVSPLVALLNNQEDRAATLAGLLGLRAFKWHGGVGAAARKGFLADPAEVLLTTPESLEAMLIGRSVPVDRMFAGLRFVIIDEVHAFAASDRGAHLSAVIERLASFSRHDVQRIGLSATVSNPAEIGRWMKGRSRRGGRVVRPADMHRERHARVVAFTEAQLAAGQANMALLREVVPGKSLVFTESRVDAEHLASGLRESGQVEYVSTYHSAISLEARERAEDAMNGGEYRTVCLTCTSAMELGIDIGDLDRALMWGPPPSVSSLLQRWGRTGRRAGRAQETTLYTQSPADTLTALAEITLAQEGWVEPVMPRTRAYHILFQQTLNRVLQGGGMTPGRVWESLAGISAFRDITHAEFGELVAHLQGTGLLADVSGTLVLGDSAERQLGRRRFQALITSFDTPDVYTVVDVTQRYEVGQLESWFVDELLRDLEAGELRPVILLTGRAWQVQQIHPATATIDVRPDRSGQAPKWQASSPRLMHPTLAWRHRELLVGMNEPDGLNPVALAQLNALRSQHQFLNSADLPCHVAERRFTLHTYAGTRINKTLELLLRPYVAKVSSGNFEVTGTLQPHQDPGELQQLLMTWTAGLSQDEQGRAVQDLQPLPLSKYLPFLPSRMRQVVVADHLLDFEGVHLHLSKHGVSVKSPDGRQDADSPTTIA